MTILQLAPNAVSSQICELLRDHTGAPVFLELGYAPAPVDI